MFYAYIHNTNTGSDTVIRIYSEEVSSLEQLSKVYTELQIRFERID